MTTVATDGRSMAADQLAQDSGGLVVAFRPKIKRLADGRIVGMAGSAYDFEPFCAWLEAGGDPAAVPKLYEKSETLVLHPNGEVWTYSDGGQPLKDELLPTAIGSGCELAIGAMEAGATPAEAVAISCKRHTGSAGPIDVIHLDDPA